MMSKNKKYLHILRPAESARTSSWHSLTTLCKAFFKYSGTKINLQNSHHSMQNKIFK